MSSRDNRRVIRVHLTQPLTVIMGSIGSDVRYNLMTRDISNNGFFLDFEKPGRFPFTPSSIMEVWMDLGGQDPIFFNGKMARVVYPHDDAAKISGPGIAIRIIQIETDQEKNLLDYIGAKKAEIEDSDREDDGSSDLQFSDIAS
ncbi:MAG: PilZ domain-containing protein [Deltaproteobacteria bacterium]|nr:PilZ domain-containing protein [Deltaproteobacteria bacterium]